MVAQFFQHQLKVGQGFLSLSLTFCQDSIA